MLHCFQQPKRFLVINPSQICRGDLEGKTDSKHGASYEVNIISAHNNVPTISPPLLRSHEKSSLSSYWAFS
jgi:hypothetical protein